MPTAPRKDHGRWAGRRLFAVMPATAKAKAVFIAAPLLTWSLLRARRDRPRSRRTAEQREEFAPSKLIKLHPLDWRPSSQGLAAVR